MKRQLFVIIYLFLLLLGGILTAYQTPTVSANGTVVIPDEAIRLRILANSNQEGDQSLKRKIRDEINAEVNKWVLNMTSIEEARRLIQNRLPEIEEIVQTVLKEENSEQPFTVNFNKVAFPTKLYGQYLYPAGNYEAILVTLGEGKGANWWCVLFPPLCFLDFSNSEAVDAKELEEGVTVNEDEEDETKEAEVISDLVTNEEDDKEEVEVKFFIVEWFTTLFS
ncbi:stage II sporulation protein R [Bacillus sp. FJAT-47783]|uniref:stage II sporulation protein R n=1 Tax=Bacillus sp. FJAT-47783 TaxID=2922712 RepID=UPI001FADEB04|nr:stage II sporulation protein R [Bacillus sp. FJAT-47783]